MAAADCTEALAFRGLKAVSTVGSLYPPMHLKAVGRHRFAGNVLNRVIDTDIIHTRIAFVGFIYFVDRQLEISGCLHCRGIPAFQDFKPTISGELSPAIYLRSAIKNGKPRGHKLRPQVGRLRYRPDAFIEQGVAMLSRILNRSGNMRLPKGNATGIGNIFAV